MASAKLFGFDIINVEAEEERGGDSGGCGGSTIAGEVCRSGIQPDCEAMSLSVCFPPPNQRETGACNPYFSFAESNSDSGSVSMDPHSCFIDFFDRESYEVETDGEFYLTPNQMLSTSGDSNTWGFYGMEEDIDLGLGIGSGSGSGQVRGEESLQVIEIDGGLDNGNKESDSGRVEVGTGLSLVGDNLFGEEEAMVADEELVWEDLQNAINLDQEPVQVSLFGLEEEEEEDGDGEVLSLASIVEDMIVDHGVMDWDFNVYLGSIYEYDENYGDFDAMFEQTIDNEAVIMGSPPASKRVVEDLPVVEITSEELSNGNIVCAICKDVVVVEEKVNRLPCRHYYHGECIIPWLGIRNTCPVCRYELPTDDLEYERNRRSQRRGLVTDLMSE